VGYIYSITNKLNGKRYIGFTKSDWHQRIYEIFSSAKNSYRVTPGSIYEAIEFYGKDNFYVSIKFFSNQEHELRLEEKRLINTLKTMYPYGYNKTNSGKLPDFNKEYEI